MSYLIKITEMICIILKNLKECLVFTVKSSQSVFELALFL